jgi:plasmid maintenance system antidote protein VapI
MRLNRTAKMAFWNARKQNGDTSRIAEMTGYSVSHVSNMTNGRRTVTENVANAMYSISSKRKKLSKMA